MTSRTARAALALAIAAAVLVGCAPQPEPTPTPTGFATEEEAFAAAEETYRAYVDALNAVDLSDPETFEGVYAWTTGEANANERESLSTMHADEWVVGGESAIERLDRLRVDSSSNAELGACVDVSAVTLTDEDGSSRVDSSRPPIQSLRVMLERSAESPTGWLVSSVVGFELVPPCA